MKQQQKKMACYALNLSNHVRFGFFCAVFKLGPDREVGLGKLGIGLKNDFLNIKNRFFVNSMNP